MAKTCIRLPELLREVDDNLDVCRKELALLPARFIGDPVGELWRLLANFKRDVDYLVTGRPGDGKVGLIQRTRQSRQRFRESIFQGAPRFKPYARPVSRAQSPKTLRGTADGLEPDRMVGKVIGGAITSVSRLRMALDFLLMCTGTGLPLGAGLHPNPMRALSASPMRGLSANMRGLSVYPNPLKDSGIKTMSLRRRGRLSMLAR